jgi:biopolymer transport protein ExbB/TolQ
MPPDTPSNSARESLPGGNPFQGSLLMLNWSKSDPEQRLGFSAGRFTSPNKLLSLLTGLALTVAFYSILHLGLFGWTDAQWFIDMFTKRGPCPYPTMLFFFWALAMLFFKWRKLELQQLALKLPVMPQQPDFELTAATARAVRERMSAIVDSPHHFILLNRIDLALANLHNIGQAADVAAILKIQAENDEAQISSSYALTQGFLWAIPVLGFIGTVQGLSQAIGAFATTLAAGGDMAALRGSLQNVTGGLATAFETTLVALVCALVLQLLVSWLQTRESEFLDTCNDICHKNVAGKLRLNIS